MGDGALPFRAERIGVAGWLPLAGGPARGRPLNRSMSSLEAEEQLSGLKDPHAGYETHPEF